MLAIVDCLKRKKSIPRTGVVSIGRSPECTLPLSSGYVSRSHCNIYEGPGGVYVEDLGSTYGTYIGKTKLQPGVPAKLESGQKLTIGTLEFDVVEEEPSKAKTLMPGLSAQLFEV